MESISDSSMIIILFVLFAMMTVIFIALYFIVPELLGISKNRKKDDIDKA